MPREAEGSVFRVTLHSSTKNQPEVTNPRKSRRGRHKESRRNAAFDPDSSEGTSTPKASKSLPRAEPGSKVDQRRIPEDISAEVRSQLADLGPPPIWTTVTFDDVPVIIPASLKVDKYEIFADVKAQKANVTIGQLLHDNVNYQKVIRDACSKRRTRKTKLPSVATNFLQVEDQGTPEVTVVVEECTILKVPIDGGSGVNLMLEDTAFDLRYTSFKATNQVLRMAD